MFRKREMSTLEKSLIGLGVAVRSDTGQALFSKMVECGHSENMVHFDATYGELKIYDENSHECLVVIKKGKYVHQSDNLKEFSIWYYNVLGGAENMRVYSKYDMYGKTPTDV